MYGKKRSNAVTIFCSPLTLLISHIERKNNHLQVTYSQNISLKNLELEKLILFNPTRIAQMINTACSTQNTPIFISLYGPALENKWVGLQTANPSKEQLPISHAPHWHWEHCYVYPHDSLFYFYLCGIPRSLILQWQLLALKQQWNLQYVTSEQMALLQLYKYMFSSAFRPSQLGIDLQQTHNNIYKLFSRDDLSRIVQFSSNPDETDIGSLLTSCGLFVAGEQYA